MIGLAEAKSIAIWGYGREGHATYNYLKNKGIKANISIIADDEPSHIPGGCNVLVGAEGCAAIASGNFDLIIKSPGISLYRPEISIGKKAGSIFTSATNIWMQANPDAKTIVVTGTKGKSTTAKLIHHILCEIGMDGELAGNVGRPLMEIETPPEITVIELSSYQIADLEFAPTIAVGLNLYPEHIPWHGDIETYYSDKLRIFSLNPAPKALLNAHDAEIKKRLGNIKNAIWFNDASSYGVHDGAVYKENEKIISISETNLLGEHNLSNIACALSAVEIIAGDLSEKNETIKNAVASFIPLPHRLELLGEKNGVLYVDDSISTTPQSALAALRAFNENSKIIILGGQDRGLDYGELAKHLPMLDIKAILTIPDNGALIAAQVLEISPDINLIECESLAGAVEKAKEIAAPGDVVLLSPAAPSFGHFTDYTERGERFAKLSGF